uniref:MFS transporter n=1 Tax=Cyberlindnera americana TaxID=36016 RepID=A0A5P8N991_9ASCO|nr:MFS transporter [Cyberlindnera americana]
MDALLLMFRGSLLGSFVYSRFNGRILKYKEDHNDYVPDEKYVAETPSFAKDRSLSFSGSSTSVCPVQVTFDGPDDPENPYNWPLPVKVVVGLCIALMSCFNYTTSSIYSPTAEIIREEFGVSEAKSYLPLTVFVYGYGLAPMIFSPLSEHPKIGRNFLYVTTLFFFFILQIPTALVNNFAGLCVLRFISGLFLSPITANGGASFVDMFAQPYAPHAMAYWGTTGYMGLAIGPLLGACMLKATNNWRWIYWFLLIVSGFLFLIFLCFVPETYTLAILHRKAERLKRVTGNYNLSIYKEGQSEITSFSPREMFWRPFVIGFTEPVVLLINIYISLVYAIIYAWLEAFPIVFGSEVHDFASIPAQLPYLSVFTGSILGVALYSSMLYRPYTLQLLANKDIHPEVFMPVCIVGSLFMPIGLFIFGWTSAKDINWFPPLIGGVFYGIAGIILFQALLSYIAFSFPRYVASAFATNGLVKALVAGSFPLFSRRLFINLHNKRFPVAWGSTVLGVISVIMILIPVLFYLNGKKLRAHSKYAGF